MGVAQILPLFDRQNDASISIVGLHLNEMRRTC